MILIRNLLLSLVATLAVASPSIAGDHDSVPPPPSSEPRYTPPLPAANVSPGLTEDQVTAIVDRAITRAISQQALAATSSPQSAYQALPSLQQPAVVQQAATQQVNVLVHPGPFRKGLAAMGAKLSHIGDPKVRSMQVAPATMVLTPTAIYTPPLPSGQTAR